MTLGASAVPPEAYLVQAMWSWSTQVLGPARTLRKSGLLPPQEPSGALPVSQGRSGLGAKYSVDGGRPVVLDRSTQHDHLVEEFDRMAEVYDAFVRPFSGPIFDAALDWIGPYITADTRAMDAGCGAGRELQRMARRMPDGEVVGIDLSVGMINAAHRSARAHGVDNCAFYQSDVGELPEEFTDEFDLVYSCLAHHHYPDPPRATREILRVLRPGGIYAVVDPGPEWFNRLASPLALFGDPGWIGFHSPSEFQLLFEKAGFARAGWVEVVPGFGVAFGQAP